MKVKFVLQSIRLRIELDHYADYYASDIKIENGFYHYTIHTPRRVFTNMTLGLPGKHNVENSIAATAVAFELHISDKYIKKR